ncbi:helix-turn-helix domain-containing protein [Paenibacillus glycanilyticus]|uniref:AraC family transcriptional regulator n=1 Tax=Paenibacillus glycanilyticus TaxID=126569 RepID=A0ABQ6GP53_9BACL|nr:AraC family transcriptional regulator [Paenibacillus glycanilyticus]GLX71238.1 AraC family transcriptional regulator [Paenibacillus glycanilyticus]
MSYPKELRENTRIDEKTHPVQIFRNRSHQKQPGDLILYLHWHEHFEIIVMQQGSGIFHIDSESYEAHPGDVLFIPAGALHVGYSLCEGDISFLAIVFNSSLFQNWMHDSMHTKYVLPYLEGHVQLPVKPTQVDPSCADHYYLLEQANAEFTAKQPGYQLMVKSQLHMLLTLLSRKFLPQQLPEQATNQYVQNRERFKSLIEYIEASFADKQTVVDAAKRMNLNVHHFCKMFKKLTGRTFIDYVNVCRVNEAERLLLAGHLTITEIAGMVGCDNSNYFTKMYKKYKSVAPSQVRKLQAETTKIPLSEPIA